MHFFGKWFDSMPLHRKINCIKEIEINHLWKIKYVKLNKRLA
jgi:hypothetical protein